MKRIHTSVLSIILSVNLFAQQTPTVQLLHRFPIASNGGWDYLAVSPVSDWLYVSHGTQVNIIHKTSGDSVGVLLNTTGVHGIAFDPIHQKGFTSNGRLNTVTAFDIRTHQVLAQIPTGINPDAILFEPYSKKIITCNGKSFTLSIIDPENNQLLDSIAVGGKPETAVTDASGNLWVNIEDKNEIVQISTKTFRIINRFSLPASSPTGLAYDSKYKRLFAGCDKKLVVLDAFTGITIAQVPIGAGCDGVAFDQDLQIIYTSNGVAGTLSVIKQQDANQYVHLQDLTTQTSARTITIDPVTHWVYLPAASFEPPTPGTSGRGKMIPGSFQVLVVGPTTPKLNQ